MSQQVPQQVPQQPFYPQQELPQQPPPQGPVSPGPQPPQQPQPKRRRRWVPWAVASGTFVLGLVIGAASSGGTASTSAGTPQATATETVQAPGSTVTVTAPPVTVTAPPVTKAAPPAKTVTAAPPEAAVAFEGDGTYEVGVDIKPGKYKSTGGDGCYWARLKNLDGGFEAIIANNLSDGPQTVTIKKTDKGFKTSNCAAWRKVS